MLIDFAIIWAPEYLFGKLCLRGCSVYTSQWKLLLFPLLSEKLKIETTYRENVNLEAWGAKVMINILKTPTIIFFCRVETKCS